MGYVLINESILSSIGNILRSKYNANVSFSTSMMHNDIDNISKWNDIVQDSNFNVSISTYNMNSLYRKCAKYLNLTILDCPSIIISSSFTNFTNLVSISLPNCSYIGSYAFTYCNNLSYISIPNCSYIGSHAFTFCSSLTNSCVQEILNTYKSYSTAINSGVFQYCRRITSLDLTGYTSIGRYAFYDCHNLSYIYLPNCSYIGSYAFNYCFNLSYISPMSNCSYIGDTAFQSCTNLSYISLPNCSYIGSWAFANCSSLTNSCVQDILNTYKSYSTAINSGVFQYCSSITSLDLTGYTSIGNSAFMDCNNLSYISLPKVI